MTCRRLRQLWDRSRGRILRDRLNPSVRSIGTSVYIGIAEDIDTPIIRSGNRNIEDVEDQL